MLRIVRILFIKFVRRGDLLDAWITRSMKQVRCGDKVSPQQQSSSTNFRENEKALLSKRQTRRGAAAWLRRWEMGGDQCMQATALSSLTSITGTPCSLCDERDSLCFHAHVSLTAARRCVRPASACSGSHVVHELERLQLIVSHHDNEGLNSDTQRTSADARINAGLKNCNIHRWTTLQVRDRYEHGATPKYQGMRCFTG
jgi:hypothetical protein